MHAFSRARYYFDMFLPQGLIGSFCGLHLLWLVKVSVIDQSNDFAVFVLRHNLNCEGINGIGNVMVVVTICSS